MADPRQLQILEAIEELLRSGLAAAEVEFRRNDFSLTDPGESDSVSMYDGDPGAPIEELVGGSKTYRHEIPLEIAPTQSSADRRIHDIHGRIKILVKADRSLGGLVDYLDLTELANAPVPVSESKTLTTGLASLIAEYTL
ncbi:hypothetical protein [Caulobacter vibrioides]|uniref:hypothetical protein n=1 Tax=Caulobacter vibrioides TaxID=155892 RepID=UPI000BB4C519|nr:hypothetical protein [Caulobacter vibrioides]ATC25209.1 hypothetical protein CA608_12055 [Caulobacter vibrioides]PLR13979.1 hypothetical protein CVUC_05355 [Caulobacter vibrioides]